uniref:Uncharacterized protein n=1 Tax=viral metagenome TaxID=1070528 RepID=A0A6H1ZLC4_9ZZZZ
MTIQIIIKGKNKYGKTKAEIAENLRKDGVDPVGGLYRSQKEAERSEYFDKKHKLRNLDENQARELAKFKNVRSEI